MSAISNNSVTGVNPVELNKEHTNSVNEKKAEATAPVNQAAKPDISTVNQVKESEISVKQLEMVAQQLQDFVGDMNKGLEFLVDKDSGRDVIKIIDKSNGDLIKQYPTEEVLDLVSKLSDATGAFINEKI